MSLRDPPSAAVEHARDALMCRNYWQALQDIDRAILRLQIRGEQIANLGQRWRKLFMESTTEDGRIRARRLYDLRRELIELFALVSRRAERIEKRRCREAVGSKNSARGSGTRTPRARYH